MDSRYHFRWQRLLVYRLRGGISPQLAESQLAASARSYNSVYTRWGGAYYFGWVRRRECLGAFHGPDPSGAGVIPFAPGEWSNPALLANDTPRFADQKKGHPEVAFFLIGGAAGIEIRS